MELAFTRTMPRLGYTVNEAHFWIYFRSIERSRPSTQTDLTRAERKRRRKKEEIARGTPNRFASRDICSFSLSLSIYFSLSHSLALDYDDEDDDDNEEQSIRHFIYILRGLFRAAISFPLKWPDPIRFHGVLRYARVHASLTLFSIDGWLVQCDRPSPS